MNKISVPALIQCKRHADRLAWAVSRLQCLFPLTVDILVNMDDTDLAILDQFILRFSKLQDSMGAKLFPETLELAKEQGELKVFLDKLYRLEKIGAIESADNWLILREVRNQFSHDYPDDPELQVATINKAYTLSSDLLSTLKDIENFIARYKTV